MQQDRIYVCACVSVRAQPTGSHFLNVPNMGLCVSLCYSRVKKLLVMYIRHLSRPFKCCPSYVSCHLLWFQTYLCPAFTCVECSAYVSLVFQWAVYVCTSFGTRQECRLLEYTNPVGTSQETHHVSATESSWLMLCKI
jgi:hypothetical protein